MKILNFSATFAAVIIANHVQGATFSISSNMDNTFGSSPNFSTTVEAPFVGSMTLSYEAASPLANGSYAWNSLINLQFSATFPAYPGVTFNQSHLDYDPSTVYVQVVDGNFFFTNSVAPAVSISGRTGTGSANFVLNTGSAWYYLTTQPLNNVTRTGFGGYVVDNNALYQFVDATNASVGIPAGQPGYQSGTPIYRGNYGNPTANVTSQGSPSSIPEPTGALTLAGLLGGAAFLRRRRA